jgi:precorrin-2 dehydrogenase/sirohydrochlorin ferrochelatase
MYPIILDVTRITIALIGKGKLAEKRLKQLEEAGATQIMRFEEAPSEAEIQKADVVFVVGFDEITSQKIAALAKQTGKLVNVEDKKEFCDFHIPSIVRRGDLLLTASTGGKSPALARSIRKKLEEAFGEEWAERLDLIGKKRQEWQSAGLSFDEVMQRSDALIKEKNWLK